MMKKQLWAGLFSLVMLLFLLPLSVQAAEGSGTAATTAASVSFTGLPESKIIDIQDVPNEGLDLKCTIKVSLSDTEWQTYIRDQLLKVNGSSASWNANGAWDRLNISFPAEIFDQSCLTIDWTKRTENDLPGFSYGAVLAIKSFDSTGVCYCGKNTGTNNSNSDLASKYNFRNIPLTLNATLTKENCQKALQQGGIKLSGKVTLSVANSNLPDLYFPVEHTIRVIDSNKPALTVADTGGNSVPFENGVWNLSGGTYTVSDTANDYEILKVSGNTTLNLNGTTIKHTINDEARYTPAISIEPGSDVKLILSGDNTIEGNRGYAGIYVSPGAKLTVSGDGTLHATGGKGYTSKIIGNAAGGAGIGGNGIKYIYGKVQDGSTASFGTITIDSGEITAVGGDYAADNTGGGAGIGTGGNSTKDQEKRAEIVGKSIVINGGTVNATGGRGWIGKFASLTGGGAGIGSGGCTGGFYTQNSIVDITINDGTVTAEGMDDGAGIGGGANVDGGTISITGGTVTATGGYEIEDGEQCDYYGGAGIGGGDNGSITSISITGGKVTAKAVGAAAGIGQGSREYPNGFPGEITIGRTADVTAEGGNAAAGGYSGGAGIGGGRYGDSIEITIHGNAIVDASGGSRAAGIGGGTSGETATITISGDAKVQRATGGLYAAGIGTGVSGVGANITISGNASVQAAGDGYAAGIGTAWKGGTATITIDGDAANVTATGGKRAAGIGTGQEGTKADITISGSASITATGGEYGAGIGTGVSGVEANITISGNALVKAFGSTDKHAAAIGSAWKGGTTSVKLKETAQIYAYSAGSAQAIGKGNAAGTASLELDDSITLWAQSGDTTNSALTENITFNSDKKYLVSYNDPANTALGYLTLPGGEATELSYTLADQKLTIDGTEITAAKPVDTVGNWATLYDVPLTVTYELDDGTAAPGANYSAQTVKYGETLTLAAAPTKSGYIFTGWSDGTNTYQPGEGLTINDNITLTALWKEMDAVCTLHYESNGGTEYEDESYKGNDVVKLNKVPVREGYQFTGWYADKALTEPITEIKMTSDKTVYAGWNKSTVPDMLNGSDHFAYIVGYSDGTVMPLNNITRAEVATIFFRLLKPDEVRDGNLTDTCTFTDVTEDMWFNKAVSTMAKLGIVKGRTEEIFDPAAPITRAEFAAICARFDVNMTKGNSEFTDLSVHWAKAEVERAVALGWIMGYDDGSFRPDSNITRAEAMTMINRVLCRIPENENDLLPTMKVWPDNPPEAWYYIAVQEATNSHDFQSKGEIYEHWTGLKDDPDWTKYQD